MTVRLVRGQWVKPDRECSNWHKAEVNASTGHGSYRGVISIDRRNTLIFVEKMECQDEEKTSNIFHE